MPETRDIDAGVVAKVAGVLVVVILLVTAVCWQLLRHWQVSGGVGPDAPPRWQARARGVEASAPQQDRAAYFAEKNRQLHSWQWLDRQAGTARIPIDAAIDLMAARTAKPKERKP